MTFRTTPVRPDPNWKWLALVLVAGVVTLLRFTVPGHDLSWPGTYEAFAHLFVGALLGAWYVNRDYWLLFVVAIMSAVELIAFFLR